MSYLPRPCQPPTCILAPASRWPWLRGKFEAAVRAAMQPVSEPQDNQPNTNAMKTSHNEPSQRPVGACLRGNARPIRPQPGRARCLAVACCLGALLPIQFTCGAVVVEMEPNNSYTAAQSVPSLQFTSEMNANIDQSTTISHATIAASGDGSVDWFVFSHGGGRMILDIDGGMPSVDLEIGLWNLAGVLVASNDDRGWIDPGSLHQYDSFIDLPGPTAGQYYVGVSKFPSSQANGFVIGGSGFTTASYSLHISSGIIPEPSTMMMCVLGGAMVAVGLRRRRNGRNGTPCGHNCD